jgi:hypothetical protein
MIPRILVFDTTHHALWAEQVALDRALGAQVMPAPADAEAKCDLALEVLEEDAVALMEALVGEGVPYRLYR